MNSDFEFYFLDNLYNYKSAMDFYILNLSYSSDITVENIMYTSHIIGSGSVLMYIEYIYWLVGKDYLSGYLFQPSEETEEEDIYEEIDSVTIRIFKDGMFLAFFYDLHKNNSIFDVFINSEWFKSSAFCLFFCDNEVDYLTYYTENPEYLADPDNYVFQDDEIFLLTTATISFIESNIIKKESVVTNSLFGEWVMFNHQFTERVTLALFKFLELLGFYYIFCLFYLLLSNNYILGRKDSVYHNFVVAQGSLGVEEKVGNANDLWRASLFFFFIFSVYMCQNITNILIEFFTVKLVFSHICYILLIICSLANITYIWWGLGSKWLGLYRGGRTRKRRFIEFRWFTDVVAFAIILARVVVQTMRQFICIVACLFFLDSSDEFYSQVYFTPECATIVDEHIFIYSDYGIINSAIYGVGKILWEFSHVLILNGTQCSSLAMVMYWNWNILHAMLRRARFERFFFFKR